MRPFITPASTPYREVQSEEFMCVSPESENDYEDSFLCQNASSLQKSSQPSLNQPFSHEEIMRFSRRKEEGFDIQTDLRYNLWLSLQDGATASAPVLQLPTRSVVSKVIAAIPTDKVTPKLTLKSSARVLTAEECRKAINEKERKKAEVLREKEERKIERQNKKEEKQRILAEKQKKQSKTLIMASTVINA